MDEDTRTQLEVIAAQARAMHEALASSKMEQLLQSDHTHHELSRLNVRARELLGDSDMAELLPQRVESLPSSTRGPARSAVMVAAQRLEGAIAFDENGDRLDQSAGLAMCRVENGRFVNFSF